ncbi:MAG: SpoIID/LytB domain-containing protein [Flavobacteriia bacterium]
MKSVLVLFLLFSCTFLSAQKMRIGLYSANSVKEFQLAIGSGQYLLNATLSDGSNQSVLLNTLAQARFKINGAVIQFYQAGTYRFQASQFELIQMAHEDFCNWSVPALSTKTRAYEGDFELRIYKGNLQLINVLPLETYLEGVVACEGGPGHQKAYYQAQAIISRTYALSNLQRHQKEGYQLCERVHCQSYLHKRTGSALIDSSVYQTRSIVLLGPNGDYFPTYFHANCGGQTCEPQDVWNEQITGLQSFKDTFCIHTKQATWVKRIPLQTWIDFLTTQYDFPLTDSLSYALLQEFRQPERSAFYLHPVYGIPLRDLREEFKLKSSFFDAVVVGEELVLSGKGFGHGVGLCQEGAMQMAKKGYSYDQILRYYYPGARLALPKE